MVRTKAEWKAIERALKIWKEMDVSVYLRCNHPDCKKAPPMVRQSSLDGGVTFQCDHADRVFSGSL